MGKQVQVALALIAKDKEDIIERALNSTFGVFDFYSLQDTGSTDNTVAIFKSWCEKNKKPYAVGLGALVDDNFGPNRYRYVEIEGRKTLGDFAQARNDSFNLIPEEYRDYAFWIDTDDVGINFHLIPALAEFAQKNDIDSVLLEYIYAQPINGLKPLTHLRERLINLKKPSAWHNRVHEGYRFEGQIKYADPSSIPFQIAIEHKRTAFESLATNRRNHLIMKGWLDEVGLDNFPTEMLSHFAYDYWEHKELNEAITYYDLLLKRLEGTNVSLEELLSIYQRVAQANLMLKKHDEAIIYAFKMISHAPGLADGHLILAQIFSDVGNHKQAEYYADEVLRLGKPHTTAPINEFDYSVVPLQIKANSALNRGDFETGLKCVSEISKILQGNNSIKQDYWNVYHEYRKDRFLKAIQEVAQYLQESNDKDAFDRFKQLIPLNLLDNDSVRVKLKELKHDSRVKKTKTVFPEGYSKSIIIYAGEGYEQWDGDSDTTKGIGGSEGMCIQMSRALASLGNKVFVYNSCGDSDGKVFEGVTYLDHNKWTGDEKCDIFISLRRPDVFGRLIRATKQSLWLHDTDYGNVPLVNMYAANKVFILSDYHKDIIKLSHGVSDDSIFWKTRNAVNKKALEYVDNLKIKRDPYKMIYGSSYDRGLDHALEAFVKIKQAVPEATLDIYYGTVTMDKMIAMREQMGDMRTANAMKQYKSTIMNAIANIPGVREFGRVSQNELYKHFAEASIWLYPTEFTEISCITAMQAQVLGAVPVCTPVAALNETVNGKFGIKTELDKIADAAIYLLKNQEELENKRVKMMEWARKEFDIDVLAKEWDTYLNNM